MSNPFFSWRSAILKSSIPPTTKLVLLTLSCHMNDAGESCFPSINLLCAETGLSNRAVVTHLHNSAELGWIKVRKQGLAGQQWARNSYQLSWDAVNVATEGSERNAEVVNVKTEGSESDDIKAVKEVHTSTSMSTSKSTSIDMSEHGLSSRGTRIAKDWKLTQEHINAALSIRAIDMEDIKKQADMFYDYWISASGEKGVRSNWMAVWRNWIRRARTSAAITVKKSNYFDD